MAFRHFAILFVAFGLLSAAASSSSSSSSTSEATSEISTTAEMTTTEISTTAEITPTAESTTIAEAASEISTTAESTTIAEAASEISTTAEITTTVEIPTAAEITTTAEETNQNPATTTAPTPVGPAFEQTVVFKVTDLGDFAANFDPSSFAADAVEDSSTVDVEVVVELKVKFTVSYESAGVARTNVAASLNISEADVEVEPKRRRLTSSTRRLSTDFKVTVTTDLVAGQGVLDKASDTFEGVESEVSVTLQIFAKAGETLTAPPKIELEAATRSLGGVDKTSIDVFAVTGEGGSPVSVAVDDTVETSSNSVLPWVFTAALAGTVALF